MAVIKFIPGVHPTYREQFDKLTRAYINNEVKAMDSCSCFVGNLLNGAVGWVVGHQRWPTTMAMAELVKPSDRLDSILKKESAGFYTPAEIYLLEGVFMANRDDEDEEKFFRAFAMTIDLLRQIHESKGEIIDEVPAFTKRELKTA